jgi:hypothetical protein
MPQYVKKQNIQAKKVISPVQNAPGQGQSKKAKQRRKAKQGIPFVGGPNLGNGYKNAFMSDSSSNSLRSMLGENSGAHRRDIYSKVNSGGVTGAGIEGQSGNMYLDCLVDPSRGPCRLPDEYDKPTAIHQEVLYFTLNSGVAAASSTNNAFYCIANPFIGIAAAATYRDATTSWGTGSGVGTWATPAGSYSVDPDRAALTGLCNNIRPVSMSLYATYVGDSLTDGGQIAAALIPGNGITTGYLSPTAQDLRYFANLALQPQAYSGPLRKGAYCFWSPEDPADTFFQTVTAANAYSFPVIMIAGTSTQSSTTVLRITAVVNYEYTTSSRLVTTIPSPIEPTLITAARKVLQSQPRCIANDDHSDWWTRVLDGARGLFTTLGNGVYSLFHPAISLVSQAANDPGFSQAVKDVMMYRGGAGAVAASLQH